MNPVAIGFLTIIAIFAAVWIPALWWYRDEINK